MELFDKNLSNLVSANQKLSAYKDTFISNRSKYADLSAKQEFHYWNESTLKSIAMPQVAVRDKERYDDYQKEVLRFDIGGSIDQYHDLASEDPHQLAFLCSLYELASRLNINLSQTASVAKAPLNTLISIGVGSGKLLKACIEQLKPYNLHIILSEYSELASSFDIIDYEEIHKQYSVPPYKICIERVSNEDQLLGALLKSGICSSDLAQVMTYPGCELNLCEKVHDLIKNNTISNIVVYTGFTVDEYNMVVNSVETLAKSPLVFSSPKAMVGGRAVVCGSGPSLDDNIAVVKSLSNSCTVIAAGSNYRTLRANCIRVDYLLLNERSYATYTDYLEVINEFGRDDCMLIMSSTCPSDLLSLFNRSAVYFRPILTPLALFGQDSEILSYEGPESVNTGFSFALELGFDEVYLFGVDLGTSSLDKVRSSAACGATPRKFDIETTGNHQDKVFTSRPLLDTKHVLEKCISHKPEMTTKIFNCSNGVLIDGTIPLLSHKIDHSSWTEDCCLSSREYQDKWYNSLYVYSAGRLKTAWKVMYPRRTIADFCSRLAEIADHLSPSDFYPDALQAIDELTSLAVSKSEQFPRRLWRSTIIKSFLAVNQQVCMLKAASSDDFYQDPVIKSYLESVGVALKELSLKLRAEGFSLCDKIDSILSETSNL